MTECRTEGCPDDPDDGEGQDGYCGNCADRLCCDWCSDIPDAGLVTGYDEHNGPWKLCGDCHSST